MLGLNQVYQGDCLEVMKSIDDNSIDLTVTSPPYDNLRTYKQLHWSKQIWQAIIQDLYRITKERGVVVWVTNDATIKGSETGTSFEQALFARDIGFNLHDTMIYAKVNPTPYHHNRYNPSFEYMFVFSKGKPKTFNPIQTQTQTQKLRAGTFRYPDGSLKKANTPVPREWKMLNNIFYYVVGNKKYKEHPAKFPYQLAEDHIYSWSNKGNIVLDPMSGSGTVGVACQNLNRNYILIEKEPEYIEICKQRLAENGQES